MTRSGGRQVVWTRGPFQFILVLYLLERLGPAPVVGIRSNTGSGAATARKTF